MIELLTPTNAKTVDVKSIRPACDVEPTLSSRSSLSSIIIMICYFPGKIIWPLSFAASEMKSVPSPSGAALTKANTDHVLMHWENDKCKWIFVH
jgi:hypothetical protein